MSLLEIVANMLETEVMLVNTTTFSSGFFLACQYVVKAYVNFILFPQCFQKLPVVDELKQVSKA